MGFWQAASPGRQSCVTAVARAQLCLLCLLPLVQPTGGIEPTELEPSSYYSVIETHAHARAQVESKFKYDPNLLCSTAGVHGRVSKEATERPIHHVSETSFSAYRSARIPIRHSNELWISDTHRFIYIRTHKSASSSVKKGMFDLFCDGNFVKGCDESLVRHVRGPLGDPDKWRDYFVFTFVRNPFTRMASAYTFFHDRLRVMETLPNGRRVPSQRSCRGASFVQFAENTETFINTCKATACCPAKKRYDAAVEYDMVDMHFNDQSHSVFDSEGKSMVDFIGRVEHFDDDWHDMWRLISERNGRQYKLADSIHINEFVGERPVEDRRYTNTCGADEFEAMYNETTMHKIAVQYALDFIRFGFL